MNDYITVTDTAKMLREAMRRHWPAVKFSVRSKSYSGGASITVSWKDGPSSRMVDAVAQRFAGADFDASIDLKSYHRDLLVDAQGNMREVHFGADFVFCRRETSDGLEAAIAAEWDRRVARTDWQSDVHRDRTTWRALESIEIPAGEAPEVTAKRAVDHALSC